MTRTAIHLTLFAALLLPTWAAGQGALTDADRAAIEAAKQHADTPLPDDLQESVDAARAHAEPGAAAHTEAQALAERGASVALAGIEDANATEARKPDEAHGAAPTYRLFLSQSMPDAELRAAVEVARTHPNLVLVVRGMLDGQTFHDLVRRLVDTATPEGAERVVPPIHLDPPAFEDASVTSVPTLIRYDPAEKSRRKTPLTWVRGVLRPEWLDERSDAGRAGDLGSYGTTYPIIESNLHAVIKERVATMVREADPEQMVRDFFANLQLTQPPVATVDAERTFDPTVVVKQTIRAHEGQIIVPAGTRINPLDFVPMHYTLFVFDGTQPGQLRIVERELKSIPTAAAILMTTRLPADQPAEALAALMKRFGQQVFAYLPHVAKRFPVQHVPARITPDGKVFRIREYAVRATEGAP